MKKAYDNDTARQLLPLLEAISREITERRAIARTLLARLRPLAKDGQAGPSKEVQDLKAELAVQRRGIRLATKELERLGCSFDEDHPTRIMIPGLDGGFDDGFEWDSSDPTLRRVSNDTSVG